MRTLFFLLVAIFGLAMPAGAQVSVNLDALNPPAAGQAATPPNRPTRPVTRPVTRPRPPAAQGTAARRPAPVTSAAATPAPATQSATNPAAQGIAAPITAVAPARSGANITAGTVAGAAAVGAAAGAAALALPEAAPANAVITAPPAPIPAPAPVPAQRPAASASAGSTTAALPEGIRVIFASGKSEMTPESAATLSEFAKKIPPGDGVSLNVVAYAAGTPEDPSTARRLSLARALAIRSSLMADGIASTRIYVRAIGAPSNGADAGPLDRVDISALGQPGVQANVPAPTPARP